MKLTELLSICLYPRRCKLCGDMVEFDKEYCDKCKGEDSFVIEEPVCLFCGNSKSDCICKDKKHYYKMCIRDRITATVILLSMQKFSS